MKTTMSVALILLISACSSTSKDIDSITRAKAIKSANEYCASKNKTVEIIEVTQKEMASFCCTFCVSIGFSLVLH